MPVADTFYERIRELAVADPSEARRLFLEVFEENSDDLFQLVERLRRPNEGRLRQLVANAVRAHPEKGRMVSELVRWRETETDEFTRRAIEGALSDVDPGSTRSGDPQNLNRGPSQLADVYRYVSDRLRHRLRNTMLTAQTQVNLLKRPQAAGLEPQMEEMISKLSEAMISLGRELEATDFDPNHFRQRPILLTDWLRQMNSRYSARYAPVHLRLLNAHGPPVRILANDYLLEIIFWNVWLNAHQATGTNCEISIEFRTMGRAVELLVTDNGEGFPRDLKDIVFQQVYSTKNVGRGRGLLEIQDAVERLAGRVELYEALPSQYRVLIRFPLEEA